jgi:hypothetical protein
MAIRATMAMKRPNARETATSDESAMAWEDVWNDAWDNVWDDIVCDDWDLVCE